ncbi:MAG: permease-like cell division protein FtsX [Bacteroidaceae bacterium]|nr:permease-like cell division protein FtsX [Bacteroidaceae bacterium]
MSTPKKKKRITFIEARITSTLSVSLVLFILGIMALLGILANNLSIYVRENIGFSIVLKESVQENNVAQLQTVLAYAEYVKAAQYISKEEALKEIMHELGENPEEIIGVNPMQASIEVRLKADYTHPDSIANIEAKLRKYNYIEDIYFQKDLIQSVNDNMRTIGFILFALAMVLMVISYVLISNTIRLTAYSRRFIIYTMKLVGATPGFIRRPFILSNILSGIIAAVIAIILLTCCMSYIVNEFDNFYTLISTRMMLIVYGIVLLLGILLTAISSFFAVNRYIGMKRDDLYYV